MNSGLGDSIDWTVTKPTPPNRRSRWRNIAAAIALAAIVLPVTASIVSYRTYGAWAWWGNPSRLHWCGRDYARSSAEVERKDIPRAGLIGDQPYPIKRIGTFPPLVGRAILASETPKARRNQFSPALPCAMSIYLSSGGDKYRPYELEGGP